MPAPLKLTVGQDFHGFTVTRTERPLLPSGHRAIWVRCPQCQKEFLEQNSNLRAAKTCGCRGIKPEPKTQRKFYADDDPALPWNQTPEQRREQRKAQQREQKREESRERKREQKVLKSLLQSLDDIPAPKRDRSPVDYSRFEPMYAAFMEEFKQQPLPYIEEISRAYWNIVNGTGSGRAAKPL